MQIVKIVITFFFRIPKLAAKIFNGRKAEIDEAPWAVRINTYTNVKNIDETWSKHCSGTLTSPRHILTATHCAATYTETEWNGTVIDAPIYRKYCEEQRYDYVYNLKLVMYFQKKKNLICTGQKYKKTKTNTSE